MSASEAAFLLARQQIGRTGLADYLKSQAPPSEDAKRAAIAHYHTLPILIEPSLYAYALEALSNARGRTINASERFPATLWLGGVKDVDDGRDFLGTFGSFVRLLEERAQTLLAAKGAGWVVEPTTNTDGQRTNASTKAMHALFLDVDGRGDWQTLLGEIVRLGFAFIAYQSGGWTPEMPKWRIIFPLTSPFDTSTETHQLIWKQTYHSARTVFGAVAQLKGEGFDPATDTPCCPWFLTEKRDANAPTRQIVWQVGHTLDLMSLVLALPPIELEVATHTVRQSVGSQTITPERFNDIVTALAQVTSNVPSGRHELYLALPGVLLDRGVAVDDVLEIIEAVSASYPRSHPKFHADNLHNAKTTIGRWQDGAPVTRIGTLNERWPEIAQAVDRVLPDTLTSTLLENTSALIGQETVAPSVPGALPSVQPAKRRRKLTALGKELLPVVKQMEKSVNPMRRNGALLIRRIIDGGSFQAEGTTAEQVDGLVCSAMKSLGFNLPTTSWVEVLDLAQATLLSMDFTQSVDRMGKAEAAFLLGQKQQRKWAAKITRKTQEKRRQAQLLFQATIDATRGSR